MGASGLLAVGLGAAFGAWLRWWLGLTLNSVFPTIPLGTLAANLLGGFLIGLAMEYFLHHDHVPVELRLFFITGFLGALTTYSTFSAETVTLFARHQYLWGMGIIASHLLGSLAMTVLGIWTVRLILR